MKSKSWSDRITSVLTDSDRATHVVGEDLTFCYDSKQYVVLKWGSRQEMEQYADKATAAGLPVSLLILTNLVPQDEVNRIINTSGYIEYFIANNRQTCLPVSVYA